MNTLACKHQQYTDNNISRVAQRKRAGPITQRSVDRNYALLATDVGNSSNFYALAAHPAYLLPLRKALNYTSEHRRTKRFPLPGIEPGHAGREPAILTTRP